MRYNLSKVMLKAWKIYRKTKGISFAESLHRAWLSIKAEKVNNTRIAEAKKAANITEPVNTWARWKELGFEVIHGSEALFSTVLIWGSRGDGAYKASFFGESRFSRYDNRRGFKVHSAGKPKERSAKDVHSNRSSIDFLFWCDVYHFISDHT